MKQKKRRLKKPIRWIIKGAVFAVGALASDAVILGLAVMEPDKMLLILSIGACLAANTLLSHYIFERKEEQHEQTDCTAGQENRKSIDKAGDRHFRIYAGQR